MHYPVAGSKSFYLKPYTNQAGTSVLAFTPVAYRESYTELMLAGRRSICTVFLIVFLCVSLLAVYITVIRRIRLDLVSY